MQGDETFWIDCPFCDHTDSLRLDHPIYPSEALRLHERAMNHIRRNHSRARGRVMGVQPPTPSDRGDQTDG